MIRQLISVNLGARGFDVTAVENGEAGLQSQQGAVPSIILHDLRMPEMSGAEFLEIVLQDPTLRRVPVVVVTASVVDLSETDVGMLPNVKRVLLKPVKMDELVAAVAEALDSRLDSAAR